eukprot:4452373-Prymnesium_polylepis.1
MSLTPGSGVQVTAWAQNPQAEHWQSWQCVAAKSSLHHERQLGADPVAPHDGSLWYAEEEGCPRPRPGAVSEELSVRSASSICQLLSRRRANVHVCTVTSARRQACFRWPTRSMAYGAP